MPTWWRLERALRFALLVLIALAAQIAIGISNVVFLVPLWLAVPHNAGGAFLLISLLMLNFHFSHRHASRP